MSSRLPLPVRRGLREPMDEASIDTAWQRRQLTRRPSSRALPMAFGIVAVAAVATLALWVAREHDAGPLHIERGALPANLLGAANVTLDDGSTIALADGARIETLANDGRVFEVLLENGRTTFDVVPHGPRRWTIECGHATVVVVGTRFTIERTPAQLMVSVERGVVLVRGPRVPNGARRLVEGESIVVEVEQMEAAAPSAGREHAPEPTPVPVDEEPTSLGDRAELSDGAWRPLAERGAYDEAYAELGATGLRREASRATSDDLLMLADVARLSGHPAEAVAPLERILSDHASDPSAGLAAFTLGCVEADSMHRPARAADAFQRAIDLVLPRALLPDAISRLARSRADAGDAVGARAAAQRYLEEFPDGTQSRSMTVLLREAP
jgi:transmembrane sensor